MTKDNAVRKEFSESFRLVRESNKAAQDITFQPALRKVTISFARIRNPLQVTANVSLFWWYKSAFFQRASETWTTLIFLY